MRILGQFVVERHKELVLSGREVVAEVRNADRKPVSIPYLVDLEHDRRKPSDEILYSSRRFSKWTRMSFIFWQAGYRPI
jgi:hypothetical protein